jgi:PAS domain S-box-containing protein
VFHKQFMKQPDETFRALAEVMPDAAVFTVDADRNITYWSPGAERLLGFKAGEVTGAHCLKSNRCLSCMSRCGLSEQGDIAGVPLVLLDADGRKVPVRKYARAFRGPDGAFLGGVELLMPDAGPPAVAPPAPDGPGVVRFHGLVTADPAMRRVVDIVRQIADSDATVLVRGESGTGKELIARALHEEGPRRAGPFLAINCAALTPTLLDSELFGHVKGAFTGAVRDHEGLFARADGGTLFLDEIAELPFELQAKLLRVLQERSFIPVGGTRPHVVDVRIVAATHRSLRQLVREGRFREDLMYRLRVVPIFLPALRERPDDVEVLARHLIADRARSAHRAVSGITPAALDLLRRYPWPGNVRELANAIDHAFAIGRGSAIEVDDLPAEIRAPAPATAPAAAPAPPVDERARIRAALERHGGNIGRAAAELGMSRPTFWRRRKALGL